MKSNCSKRPTHISQFEAVSEAEKNIKYLGCYISSNKKQLFKDNFLPLVKEFKEEVKQWQDLKINLLGRIHLFKMMCLPKFLFKFQTIPITLPKSFFKDVNPLCPHLYGLKK